MTRQPKGVLSLFASESSNGEGGWNVNWYVQRKITTITITDFFRLFVTGDIFFLGAHRISVEFSRSRVFESLRPHTWRRLLCDLPFLSNTIITAIISLIVSVFTGQTPFLFFCVRRTQIENHDNCFYDYVEIRNGHSADSQLINKYCGYKLPLDVHSTTNKLYVKFLSDSSVQKAGFSATFMKGEFVPRYGVRELVGAGRDRIRYRTSRDAAITSEFQPVSPTIRQLRCLHDNGR